MHFIELFYIFVVFANCASIYLLIKKGMQTSYEKLYVVQAVLMAVWPILLHFYNTGFFLSSTQWLRLVFLLSLYYQLSVMFFVYLFPKVHESRLFVASSIILSLLTLVASGITVFTSAVVQEAYFDVNDGMVLAHMGNFYEQYGYLIQIIVVATFYVGIRKINVLSSLEQLQLKLYLLAILLSGLVIMTFVTILPAITHKTTFFMYSPLGTIPYFLLVFYTISKYRLFDIGYFFGKILEYFILSIIVFLLFFGTFHAQEHIFQDSVNSIDMYLSVLFLSPIFVLLFRKLFEWVDVLVNQKILHVHFDKDAFLSSFIKAVSTELDTGTIIAALFDAIKKPLHIKKIMVISNKNSHNIVEQSGDFPIIIPEEMKAAIYFLRDREHKAVIVAEELKLELAKSTIEESHQVTQIKEAMKKYMKEQGIECIVPFSKNVAIDGILFIGPKDNQAAFTEDELAYFTIITANASVALSRAILHKEVEDFNKTLQQKIDEQTIELQEKVDALKKAQQRERDMLDILGHELRTPLSIIQNAFGLIEMKARKELLSLEDLKKYIAKGQESVRREIDIVENMLSATKISSGQVAFNNVAIDMVDVVEDSIDGHMHKAEEKELYITFNRPKKDENMEKGFGDRTATQRVMDNLLSNAIKYTHKGGISIDISHDDAYVTIHIADTGKGIPPEEIEKLGKKFYRVGQYLDEKEGSTIKMVRPGGTGIGLYVVYGLVKKMNGKISVDSIVGKGSTFHFSLPRYKGQKVMRDKKEEADVFKRLGLKQ